MDGLRDIQVLLHKIIVRAPNDYKKTESAVSQLKHSQTFKYPTTNRTVAKKCSVIILGFEGIMNRTPARSGPRRR